MDASEVHAARHRLGEGGNPCPAVKAQPQPTTGRWAARNLRVGPPSPRPGRRLMSLGGRHSRRRLHLDLSVAHVPRPFSVWSPPGPGLAPVPALGSRSATLVPYPISAWDSVAPRGVAGWRPERLAEARTAAGLTQGKLADLVGVSEHTIRGWERGRSAPTAHHLARLVDALGVSPAHLAPLPNNPQLRHLRQQAGLTQADIAEILGTPAGSVGQIEAGRWWPSAAERWASAYGVSMSAFRTAWETSRSGATSADE